MSERRRAVRRGFGATAGRATLMLAALVTSTTGRTAPLADAAVRARADALIAQMTPAEKAGQLNTAFYISMLPPFAAATDKLIRAGGTGSALFVNDPVVANRIQKIAVEDSRLKIPLLLGYDVIHGLHTVLPVPLAMAASWDPKLIERAQTVAAAEARAVGIDWVFAPMLDVARDARWGRIVEGSGEDPYLGSTVAAAQVRGFQGPYIGSPGHVIAGPKHFVGYGASMGGRDYDEAQISDSDLWSIYLPPFKAAIDAGAGNVMSAYMPLNGVPAAANKWLLTDVLRDTWGFKGFVVSDSNAVNALVTQNYAATPQDAAARAIGAGLDMEMVAPGQKTATAALPDAVAKGQIDQRQIDDAVRRVLEAKIRMGLFEHPYVDEKKASAVLGDPAHREVARIAAERSAVLLRNEGALLPLDAKRIASVAVIGPLADSARDVLGPWVFPPNNAGGVTILQGLRARLGRGVRIDYSEGVRIPDRIVPSPFAMIDKKVAKPPIDDTAEIARATGLARNADVTVMVLGEAQDMTGEMASRSSFDLPGRQQELLDAVVATGKPVVVVLMSGRPLDLKDTKARSILDVWYPGSEGGTAVANLLLGYATPGGKLPITWPVNIAHSPEPYNHLLSFDTANANRRYWNETSGKPTYPFGYGLSYTSFSYANLRVDRASMALGQPVAVSVDLKNTGTRAGDEVAQLYIHQRYGGAARPVRELKGFQRVTLKPGEMRTLHFTLTPADLRYWSAATKGWVQDATKFDVWAGGSSAADLAGSFEVTGS